MTANCEGCGQTHNSNTVIPYEGKEYCEGCYNALLRFAPETDDDHLEEDDGDDHDGNDPDDE